jgi:hypothetical protein
VPRRRRSALEAPAADPFERSLGQILVVRVVQLGVIFAVVTALTVAMSLAAQALR